VDGGRGRRAVADREAAEPAVADHLERDALEDRADRARVLQQRVVGVAVDVDEAGRDREAGGVERRQVVPAREIADLGDAPVLDPYVGVARRVSRPVDHGAARDEEVAHQADGTGAAAGSTSSTSTPYASCACACVTFRLATSPATAAAS